MEDKPIYNHVTAWSPCSGEWESKWNQLVQFSRSLCPILCKPMNHRMPGLPVHHQLLEFTQTHVHRASDAIQPSHPLSSPSPPAPNPSQHQGPFQWVISSHEVAKVLEFHALEKEMATHSSILAWKINPLDWWGATAHGVTKESDMTLWLNNNKVAIEFLVKC